MASTNSERIPCPSCGKTYRWKPELANRKVVCQACQTEFTFPAQPIQEKAPPPAEDDGLYDLASDPDEERELPPAYVPPAVTPTEPKAEGSESTPPAVTTSDASDADDGEPQVHISEAAKATRREEQRIAAAAELEAASSKKVYKWLIIALIVVCVVVIGYWAMNHFSDAFNASLNRPPLPDHATVSSTVDPLSRAEGV